MINLTHTVDEINTIIKALEEMPHRLVHGLLVKIHNQAVPQANFATQPVDKTLATEVAPAETDTK